MHTGRLRLPHPCMFSFLTIIVITAYPGSVHTAAPRTRLPGSMLEEASPPIASSASITARDSPPTPPPPAGPMSPPSWHSPALPPLIGDSATTVNRDNTPPLGEARLTSVRPAATSNGGEDASALRTPDAWDCGGEVSVPCGGGPGSVVSQTVQRMQHKLRGLPSRIRVVPLDNEPPADDFIAKLHDVVHRRRRTTTTTTTTTTTSAPVLIPAAIDPCAVPPPGPTGVQSLPGLFTTRWLSRVVYSDCNVTDLLRPGDIVTMVHIGNVTTRRRPYLVEVDVNGDIPHGLLDYTKFVIKEGFCGSGRMKAKRIRLSSTSSAFSDSSNPASSSSSEDSRPNSDNDEGAADVGAGAREESLTPTPTAAADLDLKHVLEKPVQDMSGQILKPIMAAATVHEHMIANKSPPDDRGSTPEASSSSSSPSSHHVMDYPWDWRQLNTTASVVEGSYCVVGNYDKDMRVARSTVNAAAANHRAAITTREETVTAVPSEVGGTIEEILSNFEFAEAALVWGGIYDGECIKIGCEHYTVVSGAGPAPIGRDIRPCPPLEDEIYAPLWAGDETITGINRAELLSGGGGDEARTGAGGDRNSSGGGDSGGDGGRHGADDGTFKKLVDEIERGIERTVVNMPLMQPQIDSEHDDSAGGSHDDSVGGSSASRDQGGHGPFSGDEHGSARHSDGGNGNGAVGPPPYKDGTSTTGNSDHHDDYSATPEDCVNIGLPGYVIRLDRPFAGRSRGLEPAYRLGLAPQNAAPDVPPLRSFLPAPEPTGCKISVPPPRLVKAPHELSSALVPAHLECPCSKWGNASRLIVRVAPSNSQDGEEPPLPCSTTTEELRAYFERYGTILRVNLQRPDALGDGRCPLTAPAGKAKKEAVKEALREACENPDDKEEDEGGLSHMPSVDMRIVAGVPYVLDYDRSKSWNIADDADARDDDVPRDINYPHLLRSTYPTKYEKWFTDMEQGKKLDVKAMVAGVPKDPTKVGIMAGCPLNGDADNTAQQSDCMRAAQEKLPGGKPLDPAAVGKAADHTREVNGAEMKLHPTAHLVEQRPPLRLRLRLLQEGESSKKRAGLGQKKKAGAGRTSSTLETLSMVGELRFTPGADDAAPGDDPSAPPQPGGRKVYVNEMEHDGTDAGRKAAIARAEAQPDAPQTAVARAYYEQMNGVAGDKEIDAEAETETETERAHDKNATTNGARGSGNRSTVKKGYETRPDPSNPAYHYVGALGPSIPVLDRNTGKVHAWAEEDPVAERNRQEAGTTENLIASDPGKPGKREEKEQREKEKKKKKEKGKKPKNVKFGPQPAFPASMQPSTDDWACAPYAIVQFDTIAAAKRAAEALEGSRMSLGGRSEIMTVRRATRHEARICNFTCDVIAPVVRSNSSTLYHASVKAKATHRAMRDKVRRLEEIVRTRVTLVGQARHMRRLDEAKKTLQRLQEWENVTSTRWEARKALLHNWYGQCPGREEERFCPEFGQNGNDERSKERSDNGGVARCDRISIGDDVFHSYRVVSTDLEHDAVVLDKRPVLEKELEDLQRLLNHAGAGGGSDDTPAEAAKESAGRKIPLLLPVLRLAEPEEQRRLEREGLEALALRKMKCTSLDCVTRVESEEMALGEAFRQAIGGTAVRVLTVARSRGDTSVDAASPAFVAREEESGGARGAASSTAAGVGSVDLLRHRSAHGLGMDRPTCLARVVSPSPAAADPEKSIMLKELEDLNEVLRQPDPIRDDPTRVDERDMDYPKGVGGEDEKNGAFETMADFHDWSASYSSGPEKGPDLSKMAPRV